ASTPGRDQHTVEIGSVAHHEIASACDHQSGWEISWFVAALARAKSGSKILDKIEDTSKPFDRIAPQFRFPPQSIREAGQRQQGDGKRPALLVQHSEHGIRARGAHMRQRIDRGNPGCRLAHAKGFAGKRPERTLQSVIGHQNHHQQRHGQSQRAGQQRQKQGRRSHQQRACGRADPARLPVGAMAPEDHEGSGGGKGNHIQPRCLPKGQAKRADDFWLPYRKDIAGRGTAAIDQGQRPDPPVRHDPPYRAMSLTGRRLFALQRLAQPCTLIRVEPPHLLGRISQQKRYQRAQHDCGQGFQ
ncbi:hypothetical protein E4T56_gene18922, partial [Termitomyces sp. T112]